MGKNHFSKYHSTEGQIKRCLRCIINDLKYKTDKLQDELTYLKETHDTQLDDLKYENAKLQDEVTYLKDELRIAQDRKDFYKYKYYKLRD